jgi:hypothetical protein
MSIIVALISVIPRAFFIWVFDLDGLRQEFVHSPDDVTVTGVDCTPEVRHANCSDSAVATVRYRVLFCANAVSNSRGDW